MNEALTTLERDDFWRFPLQLATRREPFKEWHHFVVQRPGLRLLVNFSLMVEHHLGAAPRLSPQLIVIVHGAADAHRAALERPGPDGFNLTPDLRGIAIGASRMAITAGGYHIQLNADGGRVAGWLQLRPTSRPFVVNNQPVGAGRLSWLFVPRLAVTGEVVVDGQRHQLDDDIAYHDHNWGHFRWGDDFSWMWGSVLPVTADDWTFVVMRMTDRHGHRSSARAVYAWWGGEPAGMYRDGRVRIEESGPSGPPIVAHLPPVTRLLSRATSEAPARIVVEAARGADEILLTFEPDRCTRIGFPDELSVDRLCTLDEATGGARVEGVVGGVSIAQDSRAFFEFCHG
jgi:hypothetical protein